AATEEGHNSATRALDATAAAAGLKTTVRKPLEESGKLNRTLGSVYNAILTRCPQRMSSYFWLVDRCRPNERDFLYTSARKFIGEFLDSEEPDIVLSVHPMLNHF